MCTVDHHVLCGTKVSCGHIIAMFDTHQKCVRCHKNVVGNDPCMSGEESCPACAALTPEQKAQLSVPSYKQRKEKKKDKSENSEKTDKLVDLPQFLFSVQQLLTTTWSKWIISTPHFSTTPDHSEALKKFNELFTSGFTKLESLLAKVSSHESHFDSSAFHPLKDPSSTTVVGLDSSLQGAEKPPVLQPAPVYSSNSLADHL